jgi:cytochrome c-type biogenesis protein
MLLGSAFAAGWTPCIGPILGAIIGLASASASAVNGTLLLVFYSIGLGLPFVLVALFSQTMNSKFAWFKKHHKGVSMFTGVTLMLIGFLMVTNLLTVLSGHLPVIGL